MTTYIPAMDANIALMQKLRTQNISTALAGFLSLRFTAATSATLSMSYSANPSRSKGRCYLALLGLFNFYKSIQGYDDVLKPMQELSISSYEVSPILYAISCNLTSDPLNLGSPPLGSIHRPTIYLTPIQRT